MNLLVIAASFLFFASLASAQQGDDATSYTLENGKVLHFATVEAKAKFLAARQRQQQAPPSAAPKQPTVTSGLPSVGMEATPKAGSAQYTLGDYGFGVSFQQLAGLDVRLRNYGGQPATVLSRCFFFARSLTENRRFIFAVDEKEIALKAGEATQYEVRSPAIKQYDYSLLRSAKYEGWLVQVIPAGGGKTIKKAGSASFIEDLESTPAFNEMLGDYERKHDEP